MTVVEKVRAIAKAAAESKNNFYGPTTWEYHVLLVEKFGLILAKKLHADQEIVQLACLLHDHSCLVDKKYYPQHHRHSARLARKILKQLKYPDAKIKQVTDCILSHRASVSSIKGSLEAKIVADADALSHFDALDDMFLLVYQILKFDTDQGRRYLLDKLARSYQKMSPIAKKLIQPKYQLIKQLFKY